VRMGARARVCIATYASIQQFALTPGRKLTRKVTARMRAEATGKIEIRPTGRKESWGEYMREGAKGGHMETTHYS